MRILRTHSQDFEQQARRNGCWILILVSSLAYAGCDSFQKKHDNPVMMAAPERVARVEQPEDTDSNRESDGSDIQQVKQELNGKINPWDNWVDDTPIFNSHVAATVNGKPILNGDVLDNYGGYLKSQREHWIKCYSDRSLLQPGEPLRTPDDYEQFRYFLISKSINAFIQNKLLVEYLKADLKPDQIKLMNSHIDEQFEQEVQKLKRELKVTNKTELELELNKKGTTLQNVKDNFALKRLAEECIGIKSDKRDPIERPDLVKYYQEHTELYQVPCRVKWEQIQVLYGSSTATKSDAHKKIQKALAQLRNGTPFDKVAKKYSDGPTAKDGGAWDWLEVGNLADAKLEKKLFAMPVGKISEIHEGPTSYSIVRVTKREEAGRTPFLEVQDDVRKQMQAAQDQQRYNKFMRKMYNSAVIESSYGVQYPPED